MNTPLIATDETVVIDVLSALAVTDAVSAQNAMNVLHAALLESMSNTALYGLPTTQGPLAGSVLLATYVHPYNLAMAAHALSKSAVNFGITIPFPPMQVWMGRWQLVADTPFVTTHAMLIRVIDAPPPPPIEPISIEAASIAAVPEEVNPGVNLDPTPEEAYRAAMSALADTAPPVMSPVFPKPVKGGVLATPTVPVLPFHSNYVQSSFLPDVVLTATSNYAGTGRPAKSPFERALRPRAKLGPLPNWWEGFLDITEKLFDKAPVDAIPADSTYDMMVYGLAVRIAKQVLTTAPKDASVRELHDWLVEVEDRASALPCAPVFSALTAHAFGADNEK